jgi:hypothetical protein
MVAVIPVRIIIRQPPPFDNTGAVNLPDTPFRRDGRDCSVANDSPSHCDLPITDLGKVSLLAKAEPGGLDSVSLTYASSSAFFKRCPRSLRRAGLPPHRSLQPRLVGCCPVTRVRACAFTGFKSGATLANDAIPP